MASGDGGAALPRPRLQFAPPLTVPSMVEKPKSSVGGGVRGGGGAIGRLQQKQRWPRPRFSPVGACRDAEMAKGR
jgi:hypothetical protein